MSAEQESKKTSLLTSYFVFQFEVGAGTLTVKSGTEETIDSKKKSNQNDSVTQSSAAPEASGGLALASSSPLRIKPPSGVLQSSWVF